jgi:hypothetical protein
MAVKAHEEADVKPRLRRVETRRRQDDERAREYIIVERPRWFENLARPPYRPRENGVAEVDQR